MPEIISLGRAAKRAGLREGDELVSLGGVPVTDVLDCLYHDAEESFDAEVIRAGKRKRIRVKKRADEPLDIELDAEMRPMRCKNKCLFCFVDQLPKGMRDSLYVKDDDYRFSFISGSYVTLTNLSEEEVDRMIRLRLSPIYISVHAYDDDVRRRLVSNPASDKLIGRMRRLGAHGIKMHTQIVVVPGINDGEVLERSIRGLHDIEGVETVAVVPVGLTAHREGLAELRVATREGAAAAVALTERLNAEYGGFCWCSDEYYVKAGLPPREYSYYGDFEQIENGVGLFAEFYDNVDYELSSLPKLSLGKRIACITGVDFAPFLREKMKEIDALLGTSSTVFGIVNRFFGENITVAGLVTEGDIIEQADCSGADAAVIPDNMLREFGDVFLDNIAAADVERALGVPLIVVSHSGSDLVSRIAEHFRMEEKK